jgi:hypothetical protein
MGPSPSKEAGTDFVYMLNGGRVSACFGQSCIGIDDGFSYLTYEKNGFKVLETMRFKMKKYGGYSIAEEKFFAWSPNEHEAPATSDLRLFEIPALRAQKSQEQCSTLPAQCYL